MKTTTIVSMKFLKLKRRLNLPHFQAVGVLESLWVFATSNAQDGGIGRHSNEDLAAALEWQGDPDKLIDDLVHTGWLDAHPECRLCIHDWEEHAPNFVKAVVAKKKLPFMKAQKSAVELATKVDNHELPTEAVELPTLSSEPSSQAKPIQTKARLDNAIANTVSLSEKCNEMSHAAELTHLWVNSKKHSNQNEHHVAVLGQMTEKLRLGKLKFEKIKSAIQDPERDRTETLWRFWDRIEKPMKQQAWRPKSVEDAMADMALDPVKSKNLELAFNGN
jgi:hypothetical protein